MSKAIPAKAQPMRLPVPSHPAGGTARKVSGTPSSAVQPAAAKPVQPGTQIRAVGGAPAPGPGDTFNGSTRNTPTAPPRNGPKSPNPTHPVRGMGFKGGKPSC